MVDAQEQESRTTETESLSQRVRVGLYDVDDTFLSRAKHFADIVLAKVEIHNQLSRYAAEHINTGYIPAFLTTRPAQAFLNGTSPLSYLKNIMGTNIKDGNAYQEQIRTIGCENGLVWLLRRGKDKDERESGNQAWTTEIGDKYKEYRAGTRRILEDIIKKTFVETGRYKLEEGTIVLLNIQNLDESRIENTEKTEIINDLVRAVKEADHEEVLSEVYIDCSQNDVDIYPSKEEYLDKKRTGIYELIPLLESLGFGKIDISDFIYVDDSFIPAQKASELVSLSKGVVGAPANAQDPHKRLVKTEEGIVSKYDTFWGAMAILYESLTGIKPTVKSLEAKELLNYDISKHLLINLGRKASLLGKEIIETSGFESSRIAKTNFIDFKYGVEQIVKCLSLEPNKYAGAQFFISVQNSAEEHLLMDMWKKISALYTDFNPGFSIVVLNRNDESSKVLNIYSGDVIDRLTGTSGSDKNSCRVTYNNTTKVDAISLAITISKGFLQSGVERKRKQ